MTSRSSAQRNPRRAAISPWRGLIYRLRVNGSDPTLALGLLLLAIFVYFILAPVVLLLVDAVQVHFADVARSGQDLGELTLYYFRRVLFSPVARDLFWLPLGHTAMISVGAIIVAFAVGGPIGWLLSRTDLPGRRWFSTALLVPYMLPSWTLAMAWLTLFKNRTMGGLPSWMEAIGLTTPDWIAYGFVPITLVLALHYAPFVILLLGNALKQFDTQLEDAARSVGAGRVTVARKIVLPLLLPSLMSATTLIFAKCLGDFGVTYVLGVPTGFNVLATSLFRAISTSQAGTSAVLAGVIVLLGGISVLIDMRLLKVAQRFVTIGSKGAMQRRTPLGKWRLTAISWVIIVFMISAAIPLAVLMLTTLMHIPGDFSPGNFTLDYWIGHDLGTTALRTGILITPEFWSAAWNSIWMVGLASLGAGVLGLLVGYAVVRSPLRFVSVALKQITFLPYLVPGIAFAAAYLSMFAVARPPLPALYGTPIILVLAILADQMPFASRAGISSMMQLGRDPEEAAQIVGAGWVRRMRSIVFPIQRGALVSAILLPFISGLKGLSLVIVLAVPGTDLLTTYAIRLVDYGYTQASNAVVVMLCIVAFTGTLVVQKIGKSNLADGVESR